MKIDEAIEELQKAVKACPDVSVSKLPPAMKLGIEALGRIKHLRGYSMTQVDTRLLGETEE